MLNLNPQAAALLKRVQVQNNVLPSQVEQEITTQSAQGVLNIKQLEAILVQAMPKQSAMIKACCKKVQGYHCDGTNGNFLTQILATRVEKDTIHVERPRRPTPPRIARDPYYTEMQMDPKGDFVLLFNARDIDSKGQPLLMKIIARERADLKKIDLSDYRTADDKTKIGDFDVEIVANDADFVSVKDTDEVEFTWGDPLKQVTLSNTGKEISTSVRVAPENVDNQKFYLAGSNGAPRMDRLRRSNRATGPQLDVQHVASFNERIHLDVKPKAGASEDYWLNSRFNDFAEVNFRVDRGFVFEPGAQATINYAGVNETVSVANDDAQLLGSQSVNKPISSNLTFKQLLSNPATITTVSTATGNTDRNRESLAMSNILYRNPAEYSIAGKPMQPLADVSLAKADFKASKVTVAKLPLRGDVEQNGQCVALTLEKGFLSAQNEESVKGYKVVVGYMNEKNEWVAAKSKKVTTSKNSNSMNFSLNVEDAPAVHNANRSLEIRVFNAEGVPAQRVLVPFKQIGWAV